MSSFPVEYVRLCRFCGHIGPAEDKGWCSHCRSFSGLTTLPRAEGEQIARRKRLGIRLNRLLRFSLVLVPVAGLVVWALWAFLGVAPNPPRPKTSVSASVTPQTWAQARRTPQNTGFTPEPAPVPARVKWTYTTSGPLVSSPAVANGQVYLATEDGRAVALDRETGWVRWEYHTGVPSSSVPVVAGGTVYAAFRPGLIVALEQETGALKWEKNLEAPILGSPIVVDGTLYVGAADSKLYALDAATGQERWTFTTTDWITSEVAYQDGAVIIASQGKFVHVVSAQSGRQRLVYDTGRGRSAPGGPVVQGDRVYFGSYGGRVWAIDLDSRTYPWDRPILFWKTNLFIWGVTGSPPVQKGSVWAVDLGGDATEPPAIAHDTIYATNVQGKVVALDAATGDERWSTELDSKITAAPTVAGDTLLIGTEKGTVFGLDAHTGETLWEFTTGGKVTGSPVVGGDTMYVVSHDGNLYAIGAKE